MARELKIENLVVWQLACEFEDGVLDLLERSPTARRDFKLYVQLSDAASSVSSNLAEGFYRFNAREFANFVRYSSGSLGEAERRLRAGVRKRHWAQSQADPLLSLVLRLRPALNGFRLYLLKAAERTQTRRRSAALERGRT